MCKAIDVANSYRDLRYLELYLVSCLTKILMVDEKRISLVQNSRASCAHAACLERACFGQDRHPISPSPKLRLPLPWLRVVGKGPVRMNHMRMPATGQLPGYVQLLSPSVQPLLAQAQQQPRQEQEGTLSGQRREGPLQGAPPVTGAAARRLS